MRFVVLGFCFLALVVPPGFALDRKITRQELERIEVIREMIDARGYSWQAGPTSVSHLSPEEFEKLLGVKVPPDYEERRQIARRKHRVIEALPGMAFPEKFDWRAQGGVTPVKNQGSCGSCWAFCAAAAFESQILIYTGRQVDLSEQAVLSCNTAGHGCDGGWMSTAYDLWIDYGAVAEACMPYHEVDTDPCIQDACDPVDDLDGYYYVGDNVDDLKQALLNGPVAVAMAVCGGFSAYTGGCYEDTCTEINHGVTLVGWDDTMCGGEGAWIVKNSWGPDWGENGYFYIKYGACMIGYGAEALNYNPDQTVYLFHDSHLIDDASGDGDGKVEIGEVVTLRISLLNIGAETATDVSAKLRVLSPGVDVIDSIATFPDIPKGEAMESDAPHFSFVISSGPACRAIDFQVIATAQEGSSTINLTLQAGTVDTLFFDDFEASNGWTVGAPDDDAVTGIWELGDPEGTWWGDQMVQAEDDHSPDGTNCYVTGRLAGTSRGTYDVDGGKTTLISPTIDLSGMGSALLTYYRWYSSNTGPNPNDDDFVVDVSNDNGKTWHNLETLTYDDRQWRKCQFYLEDFVSLTDEMKIRFVAQDKGVGGSIVEAAIDDISIVACPKAPPDTTAPVVTVIAPNGGEVLEQGVNYEILWSASDNLGVTSITIVLSQDGGLTCPDTIATGEINDGSYTWAVPAIVSDAARIKILAYDAAGNVASDMSDEDFTVGGALSDLDQLASHGIMLEVSAVASASRPCRILFGIPQGMKVALDIFDVRGRLIANILNEYRNSGYHEITWCLDSNRRITSGVYFVRLSCDRAVRTAKVVIAD